MKKKTPKSKKEAPLGVVTEMKNPDYDSKWDFEKLSEAMDILEDSNRHKKAMAHGSKMKKKITSLKQLKNIARKEAGFSSHMEDDE